MSNPPLDAAALDKLERLFDSLPNKQWQAEICDIIQWVQMRKDEYLVGAKTINALPALIQQARRCLELEEDLRWALITTEACCNCLRMGGKRKREEAIRTKIGLEKP